MVRSSSEPGSSLSEVPALLQAFCRRASSAERSSWTDCREACWWGAAGPMPKGAGCSGWFEWSCAVGEVLSCRSMVSAPKTSAYVLVRSSRQVSAPSYLLGLFVGASS